MARTTFDQLLQAGVHFGHLKRKWNPHMAPYIFTETKGIHIIDLHKTVVKLDEAAAAMKQIAKSGKKILFVATKKQAKEVVSERVAAVGMPYVTERWSGGMLTNFATIRKAVRKMTQIDKMEQDGTLSTLEARAFAGEPSACETREKPGFDLRFDAHSGGGFHRGREEGAHCPRGGKEVGHSSVRHGGHEFGSPSGGFPNSSQ